jgi:hemerythrin-like domain-containing protein
MLRHPSLRPLSHQHHNALALGVLGRRLLDAGDSEPVRRELARKARERYEIELKNHFELEEELLFPVCRRELGEMPMIELLISQHRTMEAMLREFDRQVPCAQALRDFYDLLASHVRAEEQHFFEDVQRRLPEAVLLEFGAQFEARAVRVCLEP